MDIIRRRLLYSVAIVVFAIVAPMMLFYAQGYRFDFRARAIVRTGAIHVDVLPRTIDVRLEDEPTTRTTPLTIRNLKPGNYPLAFSRQGYQDWSGTAYVSQREVTTILSSLLPTNPQTTTLPLSGLITATYGKSSKTIFTLSHSGENANLGLFNLSTMSYQTFARFTNGTFETATITTSANDRYAGILHGGLFTIVRLDDSSVVPYDMNVQGAVEKIVWDQNRDEAFFALINDTLVSIDLSAHSSYVAGSPGISDFAVLNNAVWVLRRTQYHSLLQQLTLGSQNDVSRELELEEQYESILAVSRNSFLLRAGDRAALADSTVQSIRTANIPGPVRVTQTEDSDLALISSPTEVWVADLKTSEFQLLSRYAAVRDAAWSPRGDTVLVMANGNLKAINVDVPSARAGSVSVGDESSGLLQTDEHTIALLSKSGMVLLELF